MQARPYTMEAETNLSSVGTGDELAFELLSGEVRPWSLNQVERAAQAQCRTHPETNHKLNSRPRKIITRPTAAPRSKGPSNGDSHPPSAESKKVSACTPDTPSAAAAPACV